MSQHPSFDANVGYRMLPLGKAKQLVGMTRMNTEPTKVIADAREIAEKEYYFLQAEVGRFDQIAIGIKNWSITIGLGLFTAAFYQNVSLLFLVSAVSSLLFWLTEARWKRYHWLHIERIKVIEAYILGDRSDYAGPAINRNFVKRLGTLSSTRGDEFKVMMLGNVRLPHMPMIILGIGLFVLAQADVITMSSVDKSKAASQAAVVTEYPIL